MLYKSNKMNLKDALHAFLYIFVNSYFYLISYLVLVMFHFAFLSQFLEIYLYFPGKELCNLVIYPYV